MRPILFGLLLVAASACDDSDKDGAPDAAPGTPDAAPGTPDGGAPVDAGPPADAHVIVGEGWLHTEGNHILHEDGAVWRGRGANLHDTRSCWACAAFAADPDEVIRRADVLLDDWGANLVRLDLESYAQEDWMVQWAGVLADPAYVADVTAIVDHITAKGAYVLLSQWVDPTFSDLGWPTAATIEEWEAIAALFGDNPRVLYGLVNEPEYNFDGAQDAEVWTAMNDAVAAIRAIEDAGGYAHHIVAVQGTGGWSRRLDYYVSHPITAGGGENVAYEVHVYDPETSFADMWITPAETIPVIIGEFGPAEGYMTEADCTALMTQARAADVPHIAWTFHMRCDPSMLVDNSGGGCGVDMDLAPTSWGSVFMAGMAEAW
jgi:hypothetical protein